MNDGFKFDPPYEIWPYLINGKTNYPVIRVLEDGTRVEIPYEQALKERNGR